MKKGILSGLKVLDLSRMLSGPYCTMMLADHGAEVIKIESPTGDTSRKTGPFKIEDYEKKWSGYFVSLNRNKKSIVIDLKSEDGKKKFLNLVEKADVLVENLTDDIKEAYLLVECPRILFPFARRIIYDLHADGSLPPLMLDPVNFAELYKKKKGKN